MKNSKNSTKQGSAKQNVTNRVATTFGSKEVGLSVAIYDCKVNGKTHRVLAYLNLTLDAYLVAIPQTGLKAQGKDRVLAVAKSDSSIAKLRVADLAISKLTNRINSSCRGKSWIEFCNEVASMTKAEFIRDENGKIAKDANGKAIKTGNKVAKYNTFSRESEGLKTRDERILNAVEKYFSNLEKKQAKLDSEAKEQPKAEKQSA